MLFEIKYLFYPIIYNLIYFTYFSAKTAQAVSSIVSKTKFGYRASADSIIDDYTSNDDLAHFRELSFIGSDDSSTPKYHRTALRLRGNGLTEEDWVINNFTFQLP